MPFDPIYLNKHLRFALHKHITSLVTLEGAGQLLVSAWNKAPSWNHFIPDMQLGLPVSDCIQAGERAMLRLDRKPCFYIIKETAHKELISALEDNAYQPVTSEVWLHIRLAAFLTPISQAVQMKIWDGSSQIMERYIKVYQNVFSGLPAGYTRQLFLAMSRRDVKEYYYYIEEEGRIIAIASAAVDGEYAGLYGGGVIKEYRHKNLGSDFMRARLSHLKSLGCQNAFLQCSPQTMPFFINLGFSPLFEGHFYIKQQTKENHP